MPSNERRCRRRAVRHSIAFVWKQAYDQPQRTSQVHGISGLQGAHISNVTELQLLAVPWLKYCCRRRPLSSTQAQPSAGNSNRGQTEAFADVYAVSQVRRYLLSCIDALDSASCQWSVCLKLPHRWVCNQVPQASQHERACWGIGAHVTDSFVAQSRPSTQYLVRQQITCAHLGKCVVCWAHHLQKSKHLQ